MATTWRVNNITALGGEVCAPWAPNHAYSLGARVVCRQAYATVARRAFVYECTTAGTSHATTEPTWPTSGTVADSGTLVWTCRSPGDGTWDNASCFIMYVLSHIAAAGDTVYVHNAHAEANTSASLAATMAGGTVAAPIKIYCVDKASDTLSTGALVWCHVNSATLAFTGYAYSYGVTYKGDYDLQFKDSSIGCSWILEGAGTDVLVLVTASRFLILGSSIGSSKANCLVILNGNINMPNADNAIQAHCQEKFEWIGGSLIAAAGLTNLIASDATYSVKKMTFRDLDLSACGSGANARALINVNCSTPQDILFERCKLSSAAGFTLTKDAWIFPMSGKISFHHCSAGNAAYDFHEVSFEGTTSDETTVVRTGGASDGTTPISMKMVSSAGAVDRIWALESPAIHGWTDSTTEKTFTVEVIHDSVTALQNDEIWMEFEYAVDNTSGRGGVTRTRCMPLAAAADITSSAETWTTTGLTNPNTRKLSVTVTPGKAGPIAARVYIAKASTTAYVDPMITES